MLRMSPLMGDSTLFNINILLPIEITDITFLFTDSTYLKNTKTRTEADPISLETYDWDNLNHRWQMMSHGYFQVQTIPGETLVGEPVYVS